MGSGIRAPETPSKSAGPRERGAAQPRFALWRAQGRGEKGLRCFPEPRRLSGAEQPSWLRGHGLGLGAEGLREPNPTSPRRRPRGGWVSRAGDQQQSIRAQGARGSPAPLCPMESGGPGVKRACVDILRGVTARLWFAAQGECPFAECSSKNLALGRHCEGASALSGQAGSGGMAGGWVQKAFAHPILLPHEGEPVGIGFRALESPSKAAGPGIQVQPSPALPYGERRAGGENSLRCFHEPRQVGDVVCCWKSFPLQNAAPRISLWAVSGTGPRR